MSYRKRPIESTDLLQDDSGALVVRGGMEGKGKPDLLWWDTGSDIYADPQTGNVTHDSGVAFIRVSAGGALVSIDDETGGEKPFIISPDCWREIVIPGGITAGSRIVAKNLTSGVNFLELAVEVR